MATLNLFPARIRFTNADGTLTHEAHRALQVLFERVGGALGDNGTDTFGDLTGVASLDLSLTDTVTQPTVERALADMVQQPVSVAAFVPDVVQPLSEAVTFDLAAATHAAAGKTTPVDADELPIADSAASFGLKKLTWANIKATLATWLNAGAVPATFTTVTATGPSGVLLGAIGTFQASKAFLQYETASLVREYTCGADAATYGERIAYVCKSTGAPVPVYTLRSTNFEIHLPLKTVGGGAMLQTSSPLTNGAGAGAGTITNAPAAGNPTKWIGINDNGTVRYIPSW